jgi:hypothetical protein
MNTLEDRISELENYINTLDDRIYELEEKATKLSIICEKLRHLTEPTVLHEVLDSPLVNRHGETKNDNSEDHPERGPGKAHGYF